MIVHLVNEVESESGWGSRIDEQHLFPTKELALEFVKSYNQEYNSSPVVPDYYIIQEYKGEVSVNAQQFEAKRYKGKRVVMPENWEYT